MPSLVKLDAYDADSGRLNVIVETPQGSRNKYAYDAKLKVFKISCLLPAGTVFPYDFGFIPSTLGDDGDPLDVLLLMEVPAPGGYLVQARLIGVIEAKQSKGRKIERNDRLIAVSAESYRHKKVRSLEDLGEQLLSEIEQFFISYNAMHGKQFKPLGRHGASRARKLVRKGEKRFQEEGE
jgi:inorganic pyrophosphatase